MWDFCDCILRLMGGKARDKNMDTGLIIAAVFVAFYHESEQGVY